MATKPTKPKASKPSKARKSAVASAPSATALPRVRLVFQRPEAQSVYVAGTFNQWHPTATPLQKTGTVWTLEIELPPGVYEYLFVVDGEWLADPQVAETAPNPFGSYNSVLRVSGPVVSAAA